MSSSRFLLDENIPKSVKKFLDDKNFLAEYVPKGVEDSVVISLAKKRKATLLTRDSDFSNRILYPPNDCFGIVIFQIHPPKPDKIVKALSLLLERVNDFEGKLFVVEEEGFIVFEG
jgi:predicted nuclease of predicted toxin-antitoxin system